MARQPQRVFLCTVCRRCRVVRRQADWRRFFWCAHCQAERIFAPLPRQPAMARHNA
jgi:hypothetical protein